MFWLIMVEGQRDRALKLVSPDGSELRSLLCYCDTMVRPELQTQYFTVFVLMGIRKGSRLRTETPEECLSDGQDFGQPDPGDVYCSYHLI